MAAQSPEPYGLVSLDGRWRWDGHAWQPLAGAAPVLPMVPVAPAIVTTPIMPKDKTAAVVLAVFFGFWAWLYTYKRDAAFFWINLVATIVTGGLWGLVVAWPWAIIHLALRPRENYLT